MNLLKKFCLAGACLTAFALTGCGDSTDLITPAQAQIPSGVRVFTASGTANVTQSITDFQTLVGGVDNLNTSGSQTTGFRSINWDAGIVPVHPAAFPPDFFNNITNNPPTRGLVVGAAGNGLNASNNDFAGINANYADDFNAFSGANTFSSTSTNELWVRFEVPNATGVPAATTGFGAVFCDVDTTDSTTVEFFNGNVRIGTFVAPIRTDANGHSFLGVVFENGQKITAAKITLGQATLGAAVEDVSDGGTNDLVIVDDFFYAEPRVAGTP